MKSSTMSKNTIDQSITQFEKKKRNDPSSLKKVDGKDVIEIDETTLREIKEDL